MCCVSRVAGGTYHVCVVCHVLLVRRIMCVVCLVLLVGRIMCVLCVSCCW